MAPKHDESQQPNNTPLSQTRRSAMKKIALGGGIAAGAAVLPTKWTQPIMDRVLVPAHAQTSDPAIYYDNRPSQKGMATPADLSVVINASLIGSLLTIGFVSTEIQEVKSANVTVSNGAVYVYEFFAEITGVELPKTAMSPSGNLPMAPIQLAPGGTGTGCPLPGSLGMAILQDIGPGGVLLDLGVFGEGFEVPVVPDFMDLPILGECPS